MTAMTLYSVHILYIAHGIDNCIINPITFGSETRGHTLRLWFGRPIRKLPSAVLERFQKCLISGEPTPEEDQKARFLSMFDVDFPFGGRFRNEPGTDVRFVF